MGQIYELRLMMDFSGENRGFCFVQYTEPAYAQRAVRELNDYEIRKSKEGNQNMFFLLELCK